MYYRKSFASKEIIFYDHFIFLINMNEKIHDIKINNKKCDFNKILYKYDLDFMRKYYNSFYRSIILENNYITYSVYAKNRANDTLKIIYMSNDAEYNYRNSFIDNDKFYLDSKIYDDNFENIIIKNIIIKSYFSKKMMSPPDILFDI